MTGGGGGGILGHEDSPVGHVHVWLGGCTRNRQVGKYSMLPQPFLPGSCSLCGPDCSSASPTFPILVSQSQATQRAAILGSFALLPDPQVALLWLGEVVWAHPGEDPAWKAIAKRLSIHPSQLLLWVQDGGGGSCQPHSAGWGRGLSLQSGKSWTGGPKMQLSPRLPKAWCARLAARGEPLHFPPLSHTAGGCGVILFPRQPCKPGGSWWTRRA